MDPQLPPILPTLPARRRSDRVSIVFPLVVAGTDEAGDSFLEMSQTTTVSRHGCCLVLLQPAHPDQVFRVSRLDNGATAMGRVVGRMDVASDTPSKGHPYGVEIGDACDAFWGIRFSSSDERILDALQDGIYFVDRERKITYWSEGAERVSGYTAEEVVGKHCYNNLLGHVDEKGTPLCTKGCPLANVMLNGEPHEVRIYLRHKQGHRVAISVRAQPIVNNAGKIVGAIEVFSHRNAAEGAWNLAGASGDAPSPNRGIIEAKVPSNDGHVTI